MRKTFLVASREYFENVKTKGFWIGIMILPLLYGVMIAIPILLERAKPAQTYAVIDSSGWLLEAFEKKIEIADLSRVLRVSAGVQEEPAELLPKT